MNTSRNNIKILAIAVFVFLPLFFAISTTVSAESMVGASCTKPGTTKKVCDGNTIVTLECSTGCPTMKSSDCMYTSATCDSKCSENDSCYSSGVCKPDPALGEHLQYTYVDKVYTNCINTCKAKVTSCLSACNNTRMSCELEYEAKKEEDTQCRKNFHWKQYDEKVCSEYDNQCVQSSDNASCVHMNAPATCTPYKYQDAECLDTCALNPADTPEKYGELIDCVTSCNRTGCEEGGEPATAQFKYQEVNRILDLVPLPEIPDNVTYEQCNKLCSNLDDRGYHGRLVKACEENKSYLKQIYGYNECSTSAYQKMSACWDNLCGLIRILPGPSDGSPSGILRLDDIEKTTKIPLDKLINRKPEISEQQFEEVKKLSPGPAVDDFKVGALVVKGDVDILLPGETEWRPLKQDDALPEGTRVLTGVDSTLLLSLGKIGAAKVLSFSEITITKACSGPHTSDTNLV